MEERLKYKIAQFRDGVKNFEESLSINLEEYPGKVKDSIKSGRVQKFEFCTELLWKTIKAYLWEINGIDSNSPKLAIKEFYTIGLLKPEEYEQVLQMLDDRNTLSHIYKKEDFEEMYKRIIETLPLFQKILDGIKTTDEH